MSSPFSGALDIQPTFIPPHDGYKAELLCPKCARNLLGHYRVEVFERDEDQKTGVHVVVEGVKATIDQSLAGNPSNRRNGLKIYFNCENCSATPVLTIEQHKGNTFFDFLPEANES